jgi:hypothetical protein
MDNKTNKDNERKTGEKYVIKQWEGVSLIEIQISKKLIHRYIFGFDLAE